MKIISNLVQGTPEWHVHRRTKRNASDAPAMLGESPYCTRTELIHRLATGIAPEVDAATQRRFDAGHAVEALLRKVAEAMLGEPLHPFVAVADFDELMSASFDGCTFVGDVTTECKLLNNRLRAAFADMETISPAHRERSAGQCLPIDYRIQMEQQVRIAGSERCLFITGELRDDGTLGDTLSCWYYPDDALWKRIEGGWPQLEADVAAYVPPAPAATVVAAPVEALPAVSVIVDGQITVRDNFPVFERAVRDFLEHRLIRAPKTDQDFADLDVQIKAMKGAEAALESADAQMLAQIEPIAAARRTREMLGKLVKDNRLMAEKMLAAEKERRRAEIVRAGIDAIAAHVAGLNQRLGQPLMPTTATVVDFAGAIKGLRSLAAMEDAVSSRLATAKIAANETADAIDANLKALPGLVGDRAGLVPDLATLVLKPADDFAAVVGQRVAAQKAAEEKRAAELAERERARIEAEAEAKARAKIAEEQRAQAAKEAAEKAEADRLARQAAEAARPAQPLPPVVSAPPTAVSAAPAAVRPPLDDGRFGAAPSVVAIRPTPEPQAQAPRGEPTLKLGDLNNVLFGLNGSGNAAYFAGLGFPGKRGDRGAVLFHEEDVPAIARAHCTQVEANAARFAADARKAA